MAAMDMKRLRSRVPAIASVLLLLTYGSCMRYLTHDRSEVLVAGVDIDQTLQVARYDLDHRGLGSVLTLWAIRDQYLTAGQADQAARLYMEHVTGIKNRFDIWHLTWAISNMYRHGDEEVKQVLDSAWHDAGVRAKHSGRMADKFANEERIWMGDAHGGGRRYAHKHVVVPGNRDYVQSYQAYLDKRK